MILQFSVTNHRSIKEKSTFSMIASADRSLQECLAESDGKRKVLPAAVLYGLNSSGKSNFLNAIKLMKEMVCGKYSMPQKYDDLPQEPFMAFDKDEMPTEFEIMFFHDGVRYLYGYIFDSREIKKEWLYYWPNGREALIFMRENGSFLFRENVQEQNFLANRTYPNRLYLTVSNQWNCSNTEKAFEWMYKKLDFFESGKCQDTHIFKNGDNVKKRILKEITIADPNISDIFLSNNEVSLLYEIKKNNGKKIFRTVCLDEQSDGFRRYYSVIDAVFSAVSSGSVLIADSLDTGLHPSLSHRIVEMMQDPYINSSNAQLIFSAYDVSLLDISLIRRDQIWFADKDNDSDQTKIYSILDFSPRKDESIAKNYMIGKYRVY